MGHENADCAIQLEEEIVNKPRIIPPKSSLEKMVEEHESFNRKVRERTLVGLGIVAGILGIALIVANW